MTSACADDSTGPTQQSVPEDQLTFLRPADNAPPLAQSSVSFWAVRGEDTEVRLFYVGGDEFLEFEVDDESLLRRPDGSLFAEDDSIQITITVVDQQRLVVDFQPTGLLFDPDEPAELSIRYANTDDDLNGDGEVDEEDDELEAQFSIWRQTNPGDPWFRIGTAVFEDLEEVEADITSFTRYAIAY